MRVVVVVPEKETTSRPARGSLARTVLAGRIHTANVGQEAWFVTQSERARTRWPSHHRSINVVIDAS
jgi:hypothetical protein